MKLLLILIIISISFSGFADSDHIIEQRQFLTGTDAKNLYGQFEEYAHSSDFTVVKNASDTDELITLFFKKNQKKIYSKVFLDENVLNSVISFYGKTKNVTCAKIRVLHMTKNNRTHSVPYKMGHAGIYVENINIGLIEKLVFNEKVIILSEYVCNLSKE